MCKSQKQCKRVQFTRNIRFFSKKIQNKFPFITENQYICSPKIITKIKIYNKFILTDNDKSRNDRQDRGRHWS